MSAPAPHDSPAGAPAPRPGTLLLAEDDAVLRDRLARAFRERGLRVATAESCAAALAIAEGGPPAMAVVDLRLPDGSGLDLVRGLRERHPATRVLVLTGYGSIATAVEAIRLGAANYLPKPADADEILAALSPSVPDGAPPGPPDTPSLDRAEWEHIHRVLAECDGNISLAARRLGIHRRSLQRKLQRHAPHR